jgi:hypothetical protein
LFVGALIPAVTGVLAITGSAGISVFFCLLQGNWMSLEFSSGPDFFINFSLPHDFPFTALKR